MTIATTGLDVANETRAFNDKLAEALATTPQVHEVDDPALMRGGAGLFPEPVMLAEGVDRAVPGRHGPIPIRTFTPPVVRGVFLHLHGGGRVMGAANAQDELLWALAEGAEVAVVSVDYRLAPESPHPAAIEDCVDAAQWLMANARGEFGVDRLVIGGESAGADLSAHTVLRLREGGSHRVFRAAYLAYGPYDMSMTPSARSWGELNLVTSTPAIRWFHAQAFAGRDAEELRDPDISALYADLHDLPAARFVVGTRDPLLDDTLFMAARWQAAGNATTLEVVAEAAHGFTLFPCTVAERELARCQEFVAEAVA